MTSHEPSVRSKVNAICIGHGGRKADKRLPWEIDLRKLKTIPSDFSAFLSLLRGVVEDN